jgi:hypothetical protein
MPLLQTTYQNESAKTDGIVLFTVNMKDSAQAIKTFFDSKSYTLSALLDSGAKVTQTYGISIFLLLFSLIAEALFVTSRTEHS